MTIPAMPQQAYAARLGAEIRRAALAALAALFVAGCATTVPLKPPLPEQHGPAPANITVGFHHGSELISDQRAEDAYGNRHEFILPVGAASDSLLRRIYPRMFARTVELEDRPPAKAHDGRVDAAIVPEIVAFHFPLHNLKGPYWAEISYRFTLYSATGDVIGTWTVKGWGIEGDGTIYGEFGPIAASVEKAMADAGRKFASSMHHEPELQRWLHGMPAAPATAPADRQQSAAAESFGHGGQCGRYPGAVAVTARVERTSLADGMVLASVRLRVENESLRRLAFDPAQVVYAPRAQAAIDPVPGAAVAAAASPRYGRIAPPPMGIGLAALPGLFAGLANAAIDSAERQSLQANLARWQKEEFHEALIEGGTASEGIVFFLLAPAAATAAGELLVPVVDLDAAVRYVVRLAVGDKTPDR